MMEVGELISFYRRQCGMTIDELAEKSGVAKGTLNKIMGGVTKAPTLDNMKAIARALGKRLADFDDEPELADLFSSSEQNHIKKYRALDPYGKEAVDGVLDVEYRRCKEDQLARDATIFKESRNQIEAAIEIEAEERKVIDLLFDEEKTAAGSGYQLIEERMQTWRVLYNDLTRKADFCLMVDGRSMEPKICDGDIILIRQQPAVSVGEIGLFTVNDKGYVKKQGSDRLISINDEFEDIIPGEYDTVFCRGKVIGILDPDWIVER